MKRVFVIITLFTLFLAGCNCGKTGENNQEQAKAAPIKVQNVDALLETPDDYAGQIVQVSGLVTHVCKHSGKRLHLTSSESDNWIRVEAMGKITNFERELKGSNVIVEGEFKKLVIDEEYLTKWESELGGDQAHHHGNGDGDGHKEGEGEEEHDEEAEMSQIQHLRERLADSESGEITSYWIDGQEYSEI